MILFGSQASDAPKNVTSSYKDNKLHLAFRLPVSFSACDLYLLLIDNDGGTSVKLESKRVQWPPSGSTQYSSVLFNTRLVTRQRYYVIVQVDFKDPTIAMASKLKTA